MEALTGLGLIGDEYLPTLEADDGLTGELDLSGEELLYLEAEAGLGGVEASGLGAG